MKSKPIRYLYEIKKILFLTTTSLMVFACGKKVETAQSGKTTYGAVNNVPKDGYTTSPYLKLKSIDFTDCTWTNGFWADKNKLMYESGVPNMWGLLSDAEIMHSKQNFLIAAGKMKGKHVGTNWIDGDTYKWLEAVAYLYASTGDKKLDQLMDEVIGYISAAQQPDGYINTHMTIAGKEHFTNLQDHETYNMGHLITAATVHHKATGKTSLLNIAEKAADCLYETFMNTGKHFLGYSSIMGLVDLYRISGNKKHIELANHFVNTQGSGDVEARKTSSWMGMGAPGRQDHLPIRETNEAVGHAVRGNYLYSGATDVYNETGDPQLLEALERIWQSVAYRKMYITGGVSALYRGATQSRDVVWEAYSEDYQLNNATAYNETCANIGHGMWSWRLLSATGNPRYADMMERVIYNSALSPISLDGKRFFYTNPLQRVDGIPLSHKHDAERWSHHMGFCCPPNIIRTLTKLSGWAYSKSDNGIAVNLYGGNVLDTELLDGSELKLKQETQYPWQGQVQLTIEQCKQEPFELLIRIPEWAEGTKIQINGEDTGESITPQTYARLEGKWQKGDVVTIDFPMEVNLIEGNPKIEEVRNQVAVTRGPLVYCIESADLPKSSSILDAHFAQNTELKANYRSDFLGGVATIDGQLLLRSKKDAGIYQKLREPEWQKVEASFIPYYAWANRGKSEMTVWLPIVWE